MAGFRKILRGAVGKQHGPRKSKEADCFNTLNACFRTPNVAQHGPSKSKEADCFSTPNVTSPRILFQ